MEKGAEEGYEKLSSETAISSLQPLLDLCQGQALLLAASHVAQDQLS